MREENLPVCAQSRIPRQRGGVRRPPLRRFRTSGDKKVIGATVLSLQFPFVVAVSEAMKAEAAKEGLDLICLDSARSVMTEKSQIESLISRKVDLIIMSPIDQATSQAAALLVR